MKTKETLEIENILHEQCAKKREYGCEEVTIGFHHDGHGDEIADFMTMDADGVFKCYEIKVSVSDLKSDAKLSFYGDLNYLVMPSAMYKSTFPYDNYIPPYAGILTAKEGKLTVRRKAKTKNISEEDRALLKDSLIRTLFWKMQKYKDASDTETVKALQKEKETLQEEYDAFKEKTDYALWLINDFETYYKKNHDDPDFTLEKAAKSERDTWFKKN